jgi:hypothetical protein
MLRMPKKRENEKSEKRLLEEGNQTVTNCNGLKMLAPDGKMRETDVADTEQLLRIIQIIPSQKAEPFKLWLAKVGNDRLDEIADPELAINRALETYAKKGYSLEWINPFALPKWSFIHSPFA